MTKDEQVLLDCINVFEPQFDTYKLDHLVYFASVNTHWSDDKILSVIESLAADNKIKIENDIIYINREAK